MINIKQDQFDLYKKKNLYPSITYNNSILIMLSSCIRFTYLYIIVRFLPDLQIWIR